MGKNSLTIEQQNYYVKTRMAQLPDTHKGAVHTVKYKESLWSIAKSKLKNGAKNAEINDYMLTIAKLNGLDTVEKMNRLKVNDKIYLPDEEKQKAPQKSKSVGEVKETKLAEKTKETKSAGKAKETKQPVKIGETKQTEKAKKTKKTSSEVSFNKNLNILLNNKTVTVKDAHLLTFSGNKLYHVYYDTNKNKNISIPTHKRIFSIITDKHGNLLQASFYETENRIKNKYTYDYKITFPNSNITGEHSPQVYGQITQDEMNKFQHKLKSLIK